MLVGEETARTARTAVLSSPTQLKVAIDELWAMLAQAGRDPASVDVQIRSSDSDFPGKAGTSLEEHRHHLGELAEAGVTWFAVRMPGRGVSEACDVLAAYGRDVIAAMSA